MNELLPVNATITYRPTFYTSIQITNPNSESWKTQFPGVAVLDHFALQKKELFKIRHPNRPLQAADLENMYQDWCKENDVANSGIWVYYPWLHTLVHLLDKEEFIELRTSRNCYKISPKEQLTLSTKSAGIIGLSVGHAVAVTMATERTCGRLILADFDSIELSNLNRIKTGLQNLGLNKAVVTAREIAEIDPFIDVTCFTDGLTEANIDDFLLGDGKLDILIDECDSIDMKIFSRQRAKALQIPVVMETSDRGMLDVERFDLEPERDILHGLLHGVPLDQLKNLTTEQKIPLVFKIANLEKVSVRGKLSMLEVGHTISTWPQLASAVTLGGAVVTDVCRRILLNQYTASGRYYIDIEQLAGNPLVPISSIDNPYQPLNADTIEAQLPDVMQSNYTLDEADLLSLVTAANRAPSQGNQQPWHWVYRQGNLFLLLNKHRAFAFNNAGFLMSYASLGACAENVQLQAANMGLHVNVETWLQQTNSDVIAAFQFNQHTSDHFDIESTLAERILHRNTNRSAATGEALQPHDLDTITQACASLPTATLTWITEVEKISSLATIIAECDRMLLLQPEAQQHMMQKEIRWTADEIANTADGIDIRQMGLPPAGQMALSILRNPEVAAAMKETETGAAIIKAGIVSVLQAASLAIITVPNYNPEDFFEAGKAMQRLWLQADALGYAIHPVNAPFFLFPYLEKEFTSALNANDANKLSELKLEFYKVADLPMQASGVFMCKVFIPTSSGAPTPRLPISNSLTIIKD